jgi:hypothetical protein
VLLSIQSDAFCDFECQNDFCKMIWMFIVTWSVFLTVQNWLLMCFECGKWLFLCSWLFTVVYRNFSNRPFTPIMDSMHAHTYACMCEVIMFGIYVRIHTLVCVKWSCLVYTCAYLRLCLCSGHVWYMHAHTYAYMCECSDQIWSNATLHTHWSEWRVGTRVSPCVACFLFVSLHACVSFVRACGLFLIRESACTCLICKCACVESFF